MEKTEFNIGYEYTRDEVHMYYFGSPYPRKGTGNWTSGYVRPKGTDDLIIFMNINVAGRTGHDFPNKYDPLKNTITWFGKPKTNSKQETFKMIQDGTLTAHFFARWDTTQPFKYLGVGTDFIP